MYNESIKLLLGHNMKRNSKGQFTKSLTAGNVAGLLLAVALIGVPMVRANSGSGKQVAIKEGQAVTVICDGKTVTPTPTPTPTQKPKGAGDVSHDEVQTIMRHVTAYGGKWTTKQIQYAINKMGFHNTKVMVAVSVAETSMGKKVRFSNNYLNWGMKSMPSVEATIDAFAKGTSVSYKGLVTSEGVVNRSLAHCYVNGCRAKGNPPYNWIKIVEWSFNKMK